MASLSKRERLYVGIATVTLVNAFVISCPLQTILFSMNELTSCAARLENLRQYDTVAEGLPCDLRGCSAMHRVVCIDSIEAVGGFLHGRKGQNASAGRKPIREACVLQYHRQARRQIANTAVTEPAAPRFDVSVFGSAEFTSRADNVVPVC